MKKNKQVSFSCYIVLPERMNAILVPECNSSLSLFMAILKNISPYNKGTVAKKGILYLSKSSDLNIK